MNIREQWENAEYLEFIKTNLLNRTDVYPIFDPHWRKEASPVTDEVIKKHLSGKTTIGSYSNSTDNTSKWLGIDLDNHPKDNEPDMSKENLIILKNIVKVIKTLKLSFCVEDSDGNGGWHIYIIFNTAIDSKKAFALGNKIVNDAKILDKELINILQDEKQVSEMYRKIERFPKQAFVKVDGFGNQLRIPGKHHKSNHYSRFVDENTLALLEGSEGIAYFINHPLNDPSILESIELPQDEETQLFDEPKNQLEAQAEVEDKVKVKKVKKAKEVKVAKVVKGFEKGTIDNNAFWFVWYKKYPKQELDEKDLYLLSDKDKQDKIESNTNKYYTESLKQSLIDGGFKVKKESEYGYFIKSPFEEDYTTPVTDRDYIVSTAYNCVFWHASDKEICSDVYDYAKRYLPKLWKEFEEELEKRNSKKTVAEPALDINPELYEFYKNKIDLTVFYNSLPQVVKDFTQLLYTANDCISPSSHMYVAVHILGGMIGKKLLGKNKGREYYCNGWLVSLEKTGTNKSSIMTIGKILKQISYESEQDSCSYDMLDDTFTIASLFYSIGNVVGSKDWGKLNDAERRDKKREFEIKDQGRRGSILLSDELPGKLCKLITPCFRKNEMLDQVLKIADSKGEISNITSTNGYKKVSDLDITVVGFGQEETMEDNIDIDDNISSGLIGRMTIVNSENYALEIPKLKMNSETSLIEIKKLLSNFNNKINLINNKLVCDFDKDCDNDNLKNIFEKIADAKYVKLNIDEKIFPFDLFKGKLMYQSIKMSMICSFCNMTEDYIKEIQKQKVNIPIKVNTPIVEHNKAIEGDWLFQNNKSSVKTNNGKWDSPSNTNNTTNTTYVDKLNPEVECDKLNNPMHVGMWGHLLTLNMMKVVCKDKVKSERQKLEEKIITHIKLNKGSISFRDLQRKGMKFNGYPLKNIDLWDIIGGLESDNLISVTESSRNSFSIKMIKRGF